MVDYIFLNGKSLFDVSNTNEFFYSIVDKEKNKYNPYVRYKANIDNTELRILDTTINDELIANNEHIRFIVYNDQYYKEYEIVVTTLPIMNISYEDNEENNEYLQQKGQDVYGEFYLYDNQNKEETITNLIFHLRGGTTRFFVKKGFKLSLKDNDYNSVNKNLLNMRDDDDWILKSLYSDQERIRDAFASRLWYDSGAKDNQFGITAGMYYSYVELFINEEYHGLYILGFPIDDKQLENQKKENLYKKENWSSEDHYIDPELEFESYPGYENKSKIGTRDNLLEYFNSLNTYDDSESFYNMMDINNNIDFYIFNIFIQNVDGVGDKMSKNMFIDLKRTEDNKYVSLYIPWDLDLTLGNTYYLGPNHTDVYAVASSQNCCEHNNSPIGKLKGYDYDNIIKSIKDKWIYLRSNYYNMDYFNKVLDEYENTIYNSGAYARDLDRWPDSTVGDYNKLDKFRSFISERLYYMNEYINNL